MVRIHPGLLERLDAWTARQAGRLSRPEAIRLILSSVLGTAAVDPTEPG